MPINDWSAAELSTDSDCVGRESKALEYAKSAGTLKKWRDEAKKEIETRLRFSLKDEQKDVTEGTDILDLIESYEPLRMSAVFMTLHLLFNDLMGNSGDLFTAKASYYLGQFEDEYARAVPQLSLDLDESGEIDDGEEQVIRTGVVFYR